MRRRAGRQHREALGQVLPRRQPSLLALRGVAPVESARDRAHRPTPSITRAPCGQRTTPLVLRALVTAAALPAVAELIIPAYGPRPGWGSRQRERIGEPAARADREPAARADRGAGSASGWGVGAIARLTPVRFPEDH